MSQVTFILERVQQGDPKAVEELLPLVYDELRRLAASLGSEHSLNVRLGRGSH